MSWTDPLLSLSEDAIPSFTQPFLTFLRMRWTASLTLFSPGSKFEFHADLQSAVRPLESLSFEEAPILILPTASPLITLLNWLPRHTLALRPPNSNIGHCPHGHYTPKHTEPPREVECTG